MGCLELRKLGGDGLSCETNVASTEPVAYQNWIANNDLVHAVILTALDKSEYKGLDDATTAADLYSRAKVRAEGEGPVRMVAPIQEVLKIQCSPNELLTTTAKKICNTVHCIFAIKTLDEDLFKCVILLNSLSSSQYKPIQAQVSRGLADTTKGTPYTSDNIQKLMETVQNLTMLKASNSTLPTDTALAAAQSVAQHALHMDNPVVDMRHPTVCIEGAGGNTTSQSTKGKSTGGTAKATSGAKVYMQLTGLKEKVYLVEEGDLRKLQTLSSGAAPTTDFAGLVTDTVGDTTHNADDKEW
ncbi:hypothetical protein E4T56_gene15164 [Termitomyces sp. T112]|nr:hypothetical protein E4T56_gene15164 [Termitomyces sp. T112]